MACVNRGADSDYRFPFLQDQEERHRQEFSKYSLLRFANIKAMIAA